MELVPLLISAGLFVIHLVLLVWVVGDANQRNANSFLWGLIVLFTGFVGWILYLMLRPSVSFVALSDHSCPKYVQPFTPSRTTSPAILNTDLVFEAWRRTRSGKEQWRIKLSGDLISFKNVQTNEDLSFRPKSRLCGIRFNTGWTMHKIVLINQVGDISFNTHNSTVKEIEKWWFGNI